MIRLLDSILLARTKLKTHKIRTSIVVGVSGILFGLLLMVVFFSQGLMDSAARFNAEGLGSRYLVTVNQPLGARADMQDTLLDTEFVNEVEAAQKKLIGQKIAEAKRLKIEYNPDHEDPPLIQLNPDTKRREITPSGQNTPLVTQLLARKHKPALSLDDMKVMAQPYGVVQAVAGQRPITPASGAVSHMVDGKEAPIDASKEQSVSYEGGRYDMAVTPSILTKPFITSTTFDPKKGEIPVLLPQAIASEALGLEPLTGVGDDSDQQRFDRLTELRSRVDTISLQFCYRNQASSDLLYQATKAEQDMKRDQYTAGYKKPALLYTVPPADSCATPTIASDTRTKEERRLADARAEFDKMFAGDSEPISHKLTLRAVGISPGGTDAMDTRFLHSMINGLAGATLGPYLAIPQDMLADVPAEARPGVVFDSPAGLNSSRGEREQQTGLVELSTAEGARAFLEKYNCASVECMYEKPTVQSFSSSALMMDDANRMFRKVLFWVAVVLSGVAMIILAGTVGRAVADGRKESAVFRAIGARRVDIALVYVVYTLLLSMRIVVFACVLGLLVPIIIDIKNSESATVVAKLAFGMPAEGVQFHFVSIWSPLLLPIIGAIIGAGLLAAVVPLLRNMRRNPINDMRDDG